MTTGTRHGCSAMPGMARARLASESLSVTFKLMPSLAKMMTIGIASGKRASALTKEEMIPMLRLCQALTRLATPTLYAVASADRTPLTAQSTPILTTSASGRCSPPCPTTIVVAHRPGLLSRPNVIKAILTFSSKTFALISSMLRSRRTSGTPKRPSPSSPSCSTPSTGAFQIGNSSRTRAAHR